jgi:hypothetical protein
VTDLLVAMRDELAAQDIVRKPSVAGAQPPMWLEPRLGVPAPGEGKKAEEIGTDAVLGTWVVSGLAPAPYNAGRRVDFVDIRLRTRTAPIATALEEAIRGALIDKRNWVMGGLTVIESLLYRAMQPTGSDKQSFDWIFTFSFETYSGLP